GSPGDWTTYGDGSGIVQVLQVAISRPGGGNFTRHCEASKEFTDWGGGCIALLNYSGVLDVATHGFNGLQFWARAAEPVSIRVNVMDWTGLDVEFLGASAMRPRALLRMPATTTMASSRRSARSGNSIA